MLKKHLFTLISLILFSISYASVFEVELPKDITPEMVFSDDESVFLRLHEYFKEMYCKNIAPGIDAVVFWTYSGAILRDNKESQKFDNENEITFIRGYGDHPWTDEEWQGNRGVLWHLHFISWDEQNHQFYGVYELAKKLVGPPLFNINVTIYKDPDMWGGIYYPQLNKIVIHGIQTDEEKGFLTHEMMHAFQDECIPTWDQFSEGFAKSCEVIIQSDFEYVETEYQELYHSNPGSMKYDIVGLTGISSIWDDFWWNFSDWQVNSYLVLFRYETCGFCWFKMWLEDGIYDNNWDFYKAFNYLLRYYYDHISHDPPSYDELKRMLVESYSPPTCEGRQPLMDWFNSQPILVNWLPEGEKWVVYSSFSNGRGFVKIIVYTSYYNNGEYPVRDKTVHLQVLDYNYNIIDEDDLTTDYDGQAVSKYIYTNQGQRLFLILADKNGRLMGVYVPSCIFSEYGKELAGITVPGNTGVVEINSIIIKGVGEEKSFSSPIIAPVNNGYFEVLNSASQKGRGKYDMTYKDENQIIRWHRIVDKDGAYLFTTMGEQPSENCPKDLSMLISELTSGKPVQFNNTVEKPDKLSLKIYPNPVYDNANIEIATGEDSINNNSNAKIELYDISGRLINTIAENFVISNNNTISFDTSNLSPGVYFIRFVCGDKSIIQPLIRGR